MKNLMKITYCLSILFFFFSIIIDFAYCEKDLGNIISNEADNPASLTNNKTSMAKSVPKIILYLLIAACGLYVVNRSIGIIDHNAFNLYVHDNLADRSNQLSQLSQMYQLNFLYQINYVRLLDLIHQVSYAPWSPTPSGPSSDGGSVPPDGGSISSSP